MTSHDVGDMTHDIEACVLHHNPLDIGDMTHHHVAHTHVRPYIQALYSPLLLLPSSSFSRTQFKGGRLWSCSCRAS
jgi:hypothetical protein